jgi:hypothetical protein
MTSHYFNIEPAVASTSISTNPNNTTSTTGATSTAPTCPTATGMKLGLGLGLGLGIPFLAALGSLIYLVLRRQASAIGMVQSFSDVAKSEYPVENYYRNTSELYEASGEPEIYQAPGSSAIFEAPESNK